MPNKNILLIEPGYKNKYPPLGLMKIAQYHGPNGRGDNVTFIKGEDKSAENRIWDRIYITTLFSFEYSRIEKSIDFALDLVNGQSDKVFVGGIAASLMHDRFTRQNKWSGVRFIAGLLDQPPAQSLQLDDFSEELYSEDTSGQPIEDLVPDYSILDQVEYRYPVNDAYFAYASRGCIRKCTFCGVPKLEGDLRDAKPLSQAVAEIDALYGPKKDLLLMDNNVVASARFKEIIAEIRDLGFTPGAKIQRKGERVPVQRRVDFNQGVDARILSKDPMFLRELSTIALRPLRIAFDHWGFRKVYEKSIRIAEEFGLTELSNYMLYNFHDAPEDLFKRMRLNVSLNEELGVRIWSFPMRYQPTNLPDRTHIGKKWSRYQLRSLQIILQATHGVVSGAPSFFKKAFGDTFDEFQELLLRPQHFIFHREWYDNLGGSGELAEFHAIMKKLGESDKAELIYLLSSVGPSKWPQLGKQTTNGKVKAILKFYEPPSKTSYDEIIRKRREQQTSHVVIDMPIEEEIVEDAGIDESPFEAPSKKNRTTRKVA